MSRETVKVSIIMPVYNVEQYLEESLNSVLDQTLKDYELICVDDGSTDKSSEILKSIIGSSVRIHSNSESEIVLELDCIVL